jgi:uncharacterized protein YggU (UPF0235/DUF167 family)
MKHNFICGQINPEIGETQRHKQIIVEHLHLCSSVCICGQINPEIGETQRHKEIIVEHLHLSYIQKNPSANLCANLSEPLR